VVCTSDCAPSTASTAPHRTAQHTDRAGQPEKELESEQEQEQEHLVWSGLVWSSQGELLG